MPYNDPDSTDPNMLVGVVLPGDIETTRDMAYVFAEEFARMGYDRDGLLRLFKSPYYSGAHDAYRTLGEEAIGGIVDECVTAWGSVRVSISDSPLTREGKSGKECHESSIQKENEETDQ